MYAKLDDSRAKDDLNVIRRRAKATEYPAAGESDIRMAIFREREKELLYEGHRYYDVVRNNYLIELDPVYAELTKPRYSRWSTVPTDSYESFYNE